MSDEQQQDKPNNDQNEPTRRDFVAMSIAAGIVAASGSASAADMPVTEKDVDIKTPDGTCDAAFIHPTTGSHPGVIIWPDAFGLRPVLREMGRILAKEGYSVLVPNPFYRVVRDAGLDPRTFDFANTADRAKLTPLMGSINAAGAAEKDALAFVAWLDQQKEVNKAKKIGTQGYCMGGPLVMRTAAASDRIGAGGSFHGGGLVTDQPEQPAPARAEDSRAHVLRRRVERRRAAAGREGQAEGRDGGGEGAGGDRGLSRRSTAGACPTSPRRRRRSTTSPRPNARGASCWRFTRPGWPEAKSAYVTLACAAAVLAAAAAAAAVTALVRCASRFRREPHPPSRAPWRCTGCRRDPAARRGCGRPAQSAALPAAPPAAAWGY